MLSEFPLSTADYTIMSFPQLSSFWINIFYVIILFEVFIVKLDQENEVTEDQKTHKFS